MRYSHFLFPETRDDNAWVRLKRHALGAALNLFRLGVITIWVTLVAYLFLHGIGVFDRLDRTAAKTPVPQTPTTERATNPPPPN